MPASIDDQSPVNNLMDEGVVWLKDCLFGAKQAVCFWGTAHQRAGNRVQANLPRGLLLCLLAFAFGTMNMSQGTSRTWRIFPDSHRIPGLTVVGFHIGDFVRYTNACACISKTIDKIPTSTCYFGLNISDKLMDLS